MTQFQQLELLCFQFYNLSDEIKKLIENEEYQAAINKLNDKETLLRKLVIAKKTVDITDDEKNDLDILEEKIRQKDKEIINFLANLKEEVKRELTITKNKVRVNTAYSQNNEKKTGTFLDFSE